MLDKYQHSDLEQIKSSSFLEQMSSIGICKAMLKLNLEFNVLRALPMAGNEPMILQLLVRRSNLLS